MKKVCTLLILCCCFYFKAISQDVIIKTDKTELKVKVTEISDDAIHYKKLEDPNGANFSIKKVDVFMILYANGTKEYYTTTAAKTTSQTAPAKKEVLEETETTTAPVVHHSTANSSARRTVFGIQGGVTSSSASFSDTYRPSSSSTATVTDNYTFKALMGFKAGIFIEVPMGNKFSFTPELSYVNKGGELNDTRINSGYTTTTTGTFKTNVVELAFNFGFVSNGNSGFMLGIAPTLSYGIGGKYDLTENVYNSSGSFVNTYTQNGDIKFDGTTPVASDNIFHLKAIEVGGNIYAGYKFSNHFNLKLNYNIGFSNIYADNNRAGSSGSYKTGYLAATIGIGF